MGVRQRRTVVGWGRAAIAALLAAGVSGAVVVGPARRARAEEGATVASYRAAAPAPAGDASAAGPYAFEQTSPDGTPARWNPCEPVRYVVNLSEAPPGALALVSAAVAQVAAATGLHFVYAGTSRELATRDRPLAVGGRWNPVLVVWERVGQSDYLPAGGEDGEGGFMAVSNPRGRWVDVTGQIALDADAPAIPGFAAQGGWAHLLLHEWGHVIGLAHVDDPTQVMNPVSTVGAPTAYGAGDRAGLSRLGAAGGCLAEPSTAGFS